LSNNKKKGVDLFPHTDHVEAIIVFERCKYVHVPEDSQSTEKEKDSSSVSSSSSSSTSNAETASSLSTNAQEDQTSDIKDKEAEQKNE